MKRLSFSTAALSLALLTAPAIFGSDAPAAPAAGAAAAASSASDAAAKAAEAAKKAVEAHKAFIADVAKSVSVKGDDIDKIVAPVLEELKDVETEQLRFVAKVVGGAEKKPEFKAQAEFKAALQKGLDEKHSVIVATDTYNAALNPADAKPKATFEIVDGVLAKAAKDKVTDAAEVTKRIEDALKPGFLKDITGKSWKWVTNHKAISIIGGVAVLAAVAGVVYWKLSQKKAPKKPVVTPKRTVTAA